MANEEWGTIAAIIYFSLYAVLLIIIAIFAHMNEEHDNKKSFFKSIWNKRGIYGQILVHLYDTATDIGVLIQWGILAHEERTGVQPIKSLDMNGLFWTSIAFLILYRIISIFIAWASAYQSEAECCHHICWMDVCFALVDMYVIKAVYQAIKGDADEPTKRQKLIQLTEAIFESLPQVVLQSVFIIRWYNHDHDPDDQATMYLVGMSLLASLFSISNKYAWVDRDACEDDEHKEIGCSKRCPIVNKYYVLRIVWRYSYVASRFAMISLVWSVLGGAFVGIYLSCSWLMWSILSSLTWVEDKPSTVSEICGVFGISAATGTACLVATPGSGSKLFAFAHVCEMLTTMSIITWFAFDSSMDCGICADPTTRQAMTNPYILSFIIAAWSSMVIDCVTYGCILKLGMFKEDGALALPVMYVDGVDEDAATEA
eukprot:35836_1